jgi:hypothetical protein
MTLMDLPRVRSGQLSMTRNTPDRPRAVREHQNTWQRTALEIAGAFLVLMGVAVGILGLRLALVLMHSGLH